MPETRSGKLTASEGVENAQEISLGDIIKEKLNEFKDEMLTEIKLLIKCEVDEALKKKKEEFDSAFTQLEKRITKLENDNEDLEQYGRRVCLRIEDVPVANEETAEEVFKKTENMLKNVCPNLSGDCIDRVHRIGPDYTCYKSQEKCRSIMVRFVSFKHRTLFYRKRASLKNVRVKIDLTKRRYEVLKKAINLVNGNNDVDYVFTDVNCRLKVVFKDKRSSFFNDIDDLKKLLEDRIS